MYIGGTNYLTLPALIISTITPRFRFHFRFGNLLVQILPPPIYNKYSQIQRPFLYMYLKLKACESYASPFT